MTGNTDGLSATPSQYGGNPNRPVEKVSWDDIQVFLTRLNTRAGNIPAGWAYMYPQKHSGSMPAVQARPQLARGDSITTSDANYNNVGQTTDVGQYQSLGLF